jgi:hypothetical protein
MVFTIHGIVKDYYPEKQIYRSYVSEQSFRKFLSAGFTFTKFQSNNNRNNVLTIDDSTYAAADACILARNLGHEVILFINPSQIIKGELYWFSILNSLLDARSINSICYNNEKYNLENFIQVNIFRKEIKKIIISKSDNEIKEIIKNLKKILQITHVKVPRHSQTLNIEDLKQLKKIGVQIESHGWSHEEISRFNVSEFKTDLLRTNEWLEKELGQKATLYAVPFGETDPELIFESCKTDNYFLANMNQPLGQISERCWNRWDITKELQNNLHDSITFSN